MPTPTYPVLPTDTKGSKQTPLSDLVVDVWPNGSARGRSYFNVSGCDWTLVHGVLSDANRQTLQTFYFTNKLLLFDYLSPWDGLTYHNVGFLPVSPQEPVVYERLPGLYWNVKVHLRTFF